MPFAFFSISARGAGSEQDDLNRFLRSHRILSIQKEFVDQAENSFWALAVEYLDDGSVRHGTPQADKKPKIDYREVLNAGDFALYSRLRDLRKQIADAEAVPVYAIFTNDQLAEMVLKKAAAKADLGRIAGVGEAKIQKYSDSFLKLLQTGKDEAAGKPD
ncbi:MAG: HRDC domain-containing protein [Pseudomonadota bacterium]